MTIPVFDKDPVYRIDYNPQNNKVRFDRAAIGPEAWQTIAVDATVTESEAINLDPTSGNDANDGLTEAAAKKTWTAAGNATTAARIYVRVIVDCDIAEDLSALDSEYYAGIVAKTGVTAQYTRRTLGFTPSDSNAIFFDKTGADGDAGTMAAPKLTIAGAVAAVDGTHQAIVCQDSETYTEPGVEFTGNFLGMYAALGMAPTFEVTSVGSALIEQTTHKAETEIDGAVGNNFSVGIMSNDDFVVAYESSLGPGKFIIYDKDGVVTVAATEFEAHETTYVSCGVLSNDDFAIAYQDGNDNKGKFCIYDSGGLVVKATTEFEAGQTTEIALAVMSSDNFIIAYKDVGDGEKGKFVILDSAGSTVKAITEFDAARVEAVSVSVFSDDGFVIAYRDIDVSKGYFVLYNSSGTVVKAKTEFEASNVGFISTGVYSDDSFVIAYRDVGDGSKGKFITYDNDGNVIISATEFEAGATLHISIGIFENDDAVIAYHDDDDSDKGKFIILDSAGSTVKAITEFDAGAADSISLGVMSDDNFVIAYQDPDDASKGKFLIYHPYRYDGLKISAAATINGFTLAASNENLYRMIAGNGFKVTAKWCEFDDCLNSSRPTETWAVYSANEVDIRNSKIHDGDQGIYSQENTSHIIDNLVYRNTSGPGCEIDGTAAVAGDITIEHNTFFGNYTGLKLLNNHGTNETIKNNIYHDNDVYDIDAQTALTTTYSIYTGSVNNATFGTGCIKANPLFVNDGDLDEDDTDLHIRIAALGDYTDSPAYLLGDDDPDRDAGGYDSIIIGDATTWSSITIPKPPTGIEVGYEFVGAEHSRAKDGTPHSSMDALVEVPRIKHEGIENDDFEDLLDMVSCGDPTVRWYGSPTTYPTTFLTYELIYENFKGMAKLYKLNRTGREDVQFAMARKYE